jgi:hypothetical protein
MVTRTSTGWLGKRKKTETDVALKARAKYLNSKTGLIKETIKGLPEAAEKVGAAVVSAPFQAVRRFGRKIADRLDAPMKYQSERAKKLRDEQRKEVIKAAIKAGDYMYQAGDEKLVPESKRYIK